MHLEWGDGLKQELRLARLRQLCPCAVCEGNRFGQADDDLHVITTDQLSATAGVREILPVGRYAIQVLWDDGHDSGIYTYGYLKSLGEESF